MAEPKNNRSKTRAMATRDPGTAKLRNDQALLMVTASEGDANMLYAVGFFVPDPFIFFQHKKIKFVVMSDLEIDRAKKQADVDRVLSLSAYQRKLRKLGKAPAGMIDILDLLFRERGIRALIVPANFSALLTDQLRAKGYSVQIKRDPFWPEREAKDRVEVAQITESLRVARLGLEAGIRMLKRTQTKRDGYLYLNGTRLTSEMLKTAVNTTIMAQGWLPSHTIISSGNQCVDTHHEGSGPIKENYATVQAGQNIGFKQIRDGINGKEVHKNILALFESRGFHSGRINGRMQGFFHGTGHGLGLDIHEPPRIAPVDAILRTGHVVTVEPGLYYIGVGGVRLEDVVVVTAKGNRNLTDCPQFLEI